MKFATYKQTGEEFQLFTTEQNEHEQTPTPYIYLVCKKSKTADILELLLNRIPDSGCCGAKWPGSVFNCSHMWIFNCSLVPKIIRMVLKAYISVHERLLSE